MSVSRSHLVGTYLAVRVFVSLFALAAVWQLWAEFSAGPWSPGGYLLVVAALPGVELAVLPPLSALSERTRSIRWR
ncbi:hypothetical protein [Candidatus Halobonum tyrrellensis]|uniref:Uncharacterized protein n=1 Tax=Candidatus Halobonum tyrrellensis G22 TaxID=1324957 RepID=V4GXV4_9EURY|nr:hypothetical protein [Candidatus Halobonum tyrrellensis]ESP89991.1 hypothetical protein K933_00472 [Candidatus Halobonum tyrrellensis G22]